MREIKFRAWNGSEMFSDVGVTPSSDGSTPYVINGAEYDNIDYLPEAILMRYTGLKDKSGVEIYEGDIGLIGTAQYAVCWNEAGAFFDLAWENSTDMDTDFLLSDAVNGFPMFEVIGNRFENPKLLEVTS